LIRTIFLKRFESSLAAFAGSCLDLSTKVLKWLDVNTKVDVDEVERLVAWRSLNEPTLKAIHDRYRATLDEVWHEEDLTEEELDELEYNLVGKDYKLREMINAAFEDLDQLKRFMDLILAGAGIDEKYLRLRDLLLEPSKASKKNLSKEVFTPEFRNQQVIVFTEFADTARYLEEQLKKDGLADVDRIDGTRGNDRYAMIKRKMELAAVGGMAAVVPALAKVKAAFAKERFSDVDGVRVDFADGWVHLRASNTEPIIRIIAEAATAERANALCDECARVAGV
jgi:hypothetical protein